MSLRRLRSIQRLSTASTIWLIRSQFARRACITAIACAAFILLLYRTFAVERYQKYGCHKTYVVGQYECADSLEHRSGSDRLMTVLTVAGVVTFSLSFVPFIFMEWVFGANRMADMTASVLRHHFTKILQRSSSDHRPQPDVALYVRELGYRGKVSGKLFPRNMVDREMFWRRVLSCQMSSLYLEWTYRRRMKFKFAVRIVILIASMVVPCAVIPNVSLASRACIAIAGILFHVAPLHALVFLIPFTGWWWTTIGCWILSHVIAILLTIHCERVEELEAVRRSSKLDRNKVDDIVFLMYLGKRN